MRASRRRILQGFGVAGGMLAAGGTLRARADNAPITIGTDFAMTGPLAEQGQDFLTGVQLGVDFVNQQGGVNGRMLQVVARDHKANPNDAAANIRELASKGINLFIAGVVTAPTLAEITVLPGVNAVSIGLGANSPALNHESFSRNFFRIIPNSNMTSRAEALLMAQKFPDITGWTALLPDIGFAHAAWEGFVAGVKAYYPRLTGKQPNITDPILVKLGTQDYRNQLAALMNAPAAGLFTAVYGADLNTMFMQARALDFTRKYKAFLDTGNEFQVPKAIGRDTPENYWSPSTWYGPAYQGNKLSDALFAAYVKKTGNTLPSGMIHPGHAAVLSYAKAIRATGSTETAAIIGALEGLTVDTAAGPIMFRKEDHQAICDTVMLGFGPNPGASPGAPGWRLIDVVKVPGADVIEAAAPGKPFVP